MGMRLGELLALRWKDVDPDACVLRVTATLKRDKEDQWMWAEPKTRRSRRQIALSPVAVAALRAHRLRQREERLKMGPAWTDYDLVFATEAGTPLYGGNVYRAFQRLQARAGLPTIRFHDLRHTCATMLLSARVNLKVVSEMLGHASVAITLDIYSHVLPDMQQDAATVMGTLLTGS
jgi:integrase